MRDGISLLDQVYSFKGETISLDDVLFILGSTKETHIYEALESLFSCNQEALIRQLQQFSNDGVNQGASASYETFMDDEEIIMDLSTAEEGWAFRRKQKKSS